MGAVWRVAKPEVPRSDPGLDMSVRERRLKTSAPMREYQEARLVAGGVAFLVLPSRSYLAALLHVAQGYVSFPSPCYLVELEYERAPVFFFGTQRPLSPSHARSTLGRQRWEIKTKQQRGPMVRAAHAVVKAGPETRRPLMRRGGCLSRGLLSWF